MESGPDRCAIVSLRTNPAWAPLIAGWLVSEWSFLYGPDPLGAAERDIAASLTPDSPEETFVAVHRDTPVGSVCFVRSDLEIRPQLTPWLASLWVAPEFRHRGTGRALIDTVVRHAQDRGVERLFLWTWTKEPLYQRLGWRTLERVFHAGVDAAVMVRDLAPPGSPPS